MKTLAEVLALLSPHKGEFQFNGFAIRHKQLKDACGQQCCPLNVLCGGKHKNWHYDRFAEELNASPVDVEEIMAAADGWSHPLRDRLIEAVGLEE